MKTWSFRVMETACHEVLPEMSEIPIQNLGIPQTNKGFASRVRQLLAIVDVCFVSS